METWSLIIGITSLIVGILSIVLAIVAMIASKKETDRSANNYRNTKELLNKIEHKSDLIDRAVQVQQTQLVQIINKALDKIGQSPIELQPVTEEDINALFEEKKKPIDAEIRKLKNKVDAIPKIHIGNEPPQDPKNGDLWFQPK
ncbi:MAG: hypothetical protein IKU25_07520 [Clostridia bacterium]|nr:hypothetical protein [Clostridia bacterium]